MRPRGTPEALPVLSRGKHRNPRKGGCFMEFASMLAGEKWSDHPKCTHPLLSSVARGVNDHTSDSGRGRLVGLIPRVVGLTGDDPLIDLGIAVRCASLAIPVAADHRQKALAAGLLAAQRVALQHDDESSTVDTYQVFQDASDALASVPHHYRWVEDMAPDSRLSLPVFQRRSAPTIVRVAIVGIAEACIPDTDTLLYRLLDETVEDSITWMGSDFTRPTMTHHDVRELAH